MPLLVAIGSGKCLAPGTAKGSSGSEIRLVRHFHAALQQTTSFELQASLASYPPRRKAVILLHHYLGICEELKSKAAPQVTRSLPISNPHSELERLSELQRWLKWHDHGNPKFLDGGQQITSWFLRKDHMQANTIPLSLLSYLNY